MLVPNIGSKNFDILRKQHHKVFNSLEKRSLLDKMIFTDPDTNEYEVKIKGGKLMAWLEGNKSHDLKKVTRKSPTMGAKPPKGAVILFDGTSVDKFKNAKLSEDKLLIPRADSIQRFSSHKLHIEFFLPFKP